MRTLQRNIHCRGSLAAMLSIRNFREAAENTFIETDARILKKFLLLKLYRAANGRLTKKDYGPIGE